MNKIGQISRHFISWITIADKMKNRVGLPGSEPMSPLSSTYIRYIGKGR